jgi:hypothetical protein
MHRLSYVTSCCSVDHSWVLPQHVGLALRSIAPGNHDLVRNDGTVLRHFAHAWTMAGCLPATRTSLASPANLLTTLIHDRVNDVLRFLH